MILLMFVQKKIKRIKILDNFNNNNNYNINSNNNYLNTYISTKSSYSALNSINYRPKRILSAVV